LVAVMKTRRERSWREGPHPRDHRSVLVHVRQRGRRRLFPALRRGRRLRDRLRERSGRFTSRDHQTGTLFDELTSDSARARTMVLRRIKVSPTQRRARRAQAHVDRDPGY